MKRVIFLSIFFGILFSSCCNLEIKKKLASAESLLQIQPDSSLSILESIASNDILTREAKARYALLMTAALNKNYIVISSDCGLFFTNFYPQVSTGTSSDTEFTILTSLMPASSGTVFVSYYNREYNTIPKYLKELGYKTFSVHGNHASMWNRSKVHPRLGYDKMYFEEYFEYTEDDVINLGINDSLFFKQVVPLLEEYEKDSTPYMSTVITLSNHSPFIYKDKYISL